MTASIRIDPAAAIGAVPRRLFGTFVEHMGRSVHGGAEGDAIAAELPEPSWTVIRLARDARELHEEETL